MSRLLEPVRVGFREWRTVAVLLCANWLVAGLMVAPTGPTVWAAFGHAPLAQGKPVVSSELLMSLRSLFAGGGMPSIAAPLLLLVVLQTFLVGGVVWRACADGPFRLGAFLGQSGRLVGRNARLYLWLLLLLGAVMLVPVGLAALMHVLGLPTLFTMHAETWIFGSPFGVTGVLHLAVLGVALALWRLSLEVGRVLIFRDDLRTTRRAAWRALRLVLRDPLSIVLYAALGAVATGAVLVLMRGRAMLPQGNAGLALLALGVGQIVVWTRLAFQVAGTRFAAALVQRTDATPRHVEHLEERVEAAPPV
ncbi:MAG TPA: hypothetical protein VFN45_04515 [Myxococcaceae bacterium]|nr:hypothetical protein [Myxococcaceae bacterium]